MGTLAVIGHNGPPSSIETATDVLAPLGTFLSEHPVILNEDEAREANKLKDRGAAMVADMEAERDKLVRPLNAQVKAINDRYRPARDALEKVIGQLKIRLTIFARAEEAKRRVAAEAAQRAAEDAVRKAREAMEREQAAHEDAAQGICDIDVVAPAQEAIRAVNDARKAERVAARAERDSHVRIGGGYGKVATLRTHEVLTIADLFAALQEMGLTEKVKDAVLSSARDYRKLFGELPDGIEATHERTV